MVPWETLLNFVKDYQSNNLNELRNKLILNLMINNFKEIDGIKYHTLLRVTEYATLHLWTGKKAPPSNKENYIWLNKNQLYIQEIW